MGGKDALAADLITVWPYKEKINPDRVNVNVQSTVWPLGVSRHYRSYSWFVDSKAFVCTQQMDRN